MNCSDSAVLFSLILRLARRLICHTKNAMIATKPTPAADALAIIILLRLEAAGGTTVAMLVLLADKILEEEIVSCICTLVVEVVTDDDDDDDNDDDDEQTADAGTEGQRQLAPLYAHAPGTVPILQTSQV